MKALFSNLYYSFPLQLILLHFKKHQVLLVFWLTLFGIVTGRLGAKLGIPYLFLDPEYLGQVNFLSFLLVGFAFGGFLMSWNITCYILHSFRFPFLATLSAPFSKFCLNNSVIPLLFMGTYLFSAGKFLTGSEFVLVDRLILNFLGFILGCSFMIVLILLYFFNTNKNIFMLFGVKLPEPPRKRKEGKQHDRSTWMSDKRKHKIWPVKFYLAIPFKVRLVRSVDHYQPEQIQSVFRQNHINSMIIELIAFTFLISLGYLIDYPAFRIPAASSVLLLFSILIMLISAFSFWLRGWRTTVFIAILLALNYLLKLKIVDFSNHAYGLNYETEKVAYTLDNLQELSSNDNFKKDKKEALVMLKNWRDKAVKNVSGRKQPKLIFINASGGGLRSAVWTTKVLQYADSLLNGRLFDHTLMITGASAGIIGASYYRELYLLKQSNPGLDMNDPVFINNISKDLLNPICFTWVVNDLFYLWHKFDYGGYRYQKDRGYIFEKQLDENTGHILDKKLTDYREPEINGTIPMLVMCPTMMNDGRRLILAAQPVSYLTRPSGNYFLFSTAEIDGIEFMRFFAGQDATNLKFTSALRMNATFPYITPDVALPSDPVIEVMDAGMRDNFGVQTSVRFLHVFRNWISKNTGGVIFIQIRDTKKQAEISHKGNPTIADKVLNPIGSFYLNWSDFQDFYHDNLTYYASAWLQGRMDVISFEYSPEANTEEVSLSWHLTTKEKQNVLASIKAINNQESFQRLVRLLDTEGS